MDRCSAACVDGSGKDLGRKQKCVLKLGVFSDKEGKFAVGKPN